MELTTQDQTIRRNWLITYFISLAYNATVVLLNTPIPPEMLKLFVSVFLVIFAATGYLLYHCAYRKKGTKLLTAVMILGALGTAYSLYLPFSPASLPFSLPVYFTSLALSCIVMYAHYRLLQVNKRLKTAAPKL